MRIPALLFLSAVTLYGLNIGDQVKILRDTHPYYDQNGTVVSLSSTGATIDYDGDGIHEASGGISLSTEGVNWEVISNANITPRFSPGEQIIILPNLGYFTGSGYAPHGVPLTVGQTIAVNDQIYMSEATDAFGETYSFHNQESIASFPPLDLTKIIVLWQDDDGDGINDPVEQDPNADDDGDGVTNANDSDDDGDGIPDQFQQLDDFWGAGIVGDVWGNPGEGGQSITETNGSVTITSNVDTDNDVPTLLQILAKLDSFHSDTSTLLGQLNGQGQSLENSRDDIQPPGEGDLPSDLLPQEGISDLFSGAGGSMPNTSLTVGTHNVDIDLQDSRWDTVFLLAKVGLTSLVVVGSITATWKTSAMLLSV